MAINERLIDTEVAAAGNGGGGNAGEEGLILHLDANDVDSYDGDGTEWVDIKDHEYTPATNADEHFNTVLYAGNGSATSITGVGFEPELVWIKRRDSSGSNYLFDQVRGVHKALISEQTYAEIDNSGYLTSFDSDGFSLGTNSALVGNGNSYVAWCFKAGGAAVSNTDGTITSQVSANNDLGFSIVSYTGAASGTVGHGLGVPPELIITKQTVSTGVWATYSKTLGTDKLLELNSNSGAQSVSNYWGTSAPTSTVYGLSTNSAHYNANGAQIAYCFASKRGVSKVGSYTGTGATNKVYTGFEPAFIIGKCSSDDVTNWWIFDNKREDKVLYPNLSNSEDTLSDYVSFNRDGFTLSNAAFVNQSGRTFIYYAVAKDTNETSLIPDTDLELHLDAADLTSEANTTWTDKASSLVLTKNGTVDYNDELGDFIDFGGGYYGNDNNLNTSIKDSNGDFTIEFWYNFDAFSGTNSPIGIMQTASLRGLWIYFGGSTMDVYNYKSNAHSGSQYTSQTFSTLGISTGEWYHITHVIDASTDIKTYVNGELKATSTSNAGGTHWTSMYGIRIGGMQTLPYSNDGKMGQFRIYSSALTENQIRQNFNFTKPSYPNGYNGTITGATWYPDGYFDFDGLNDEVVIPMSFSGGGSIGMWVNITDINANNAIASKYTSGTDNRSFAWYVYNDGGVGKAVFSIYYNTSGAGNAVQFTMSNYFTSGQWHHIMHTFDASNRPTIYVDGEAIPVLSQYDSASQNVIYSRPSVPVVLGQFDGSTSDAYDFDGKISDFKIYDKALSAAEVTAQFAIKQFDIG